MVRNVPPLSSIYLLIRSIHLQVNPPCVCRCPAPSPTRTLPPLCGLLHLVRPPLPLPSALGHAPPPADALTLGPGPLHPRAEGGTALPSPMAPPAPSPWLGCPTMLASLPLGPQHLAQATASQAAHHPPPAKIKRLTGNPAPEGKRDVRKEKFDGVLITLQRRLSILPLPKAALPQSHIFKAAARLES